MNENPYEENLQNPLEKYGRDIVQAVKDNKIDPVIGRDDEIRKQLFDAGIKPGFFSVKDTNRK